MFTARYIKEGKMLLKGVSKFIHYKRDILPEAKLAAIREKQDAFAALLKTGTKEEVRTEAKELQKVCERSLPMPTLPGIRENVEVFFVAIVIALGIRSYFLQPFKIPTGSMQPTLNGIIATSYGSNLDAEWEKVEPNILKKGWEIVWNGRNYVDLRAEEDFVPTRVYQKNWLKFFSFTYVDRVGVNGEKLKPLKIWAPLDKSLELGLRNLMSFDKTMQGSKAAPVAIVDRVNTPNNRIESGQLMARGFVDTGDQVLVNKFSYHFRKPERGETFVFTTKGIIPIEKKNGSTDSQHYIKRLCAVPGDTFEVKPPQLFINGELAKEPGIVRVMKQENGHRGFTINGSFISGTLGEKEYLALGDNSANSWDSRGWGTVKESNLVGPALFVYWPFGAHWGLID